MGLFRWVDLALVVILPLAAWWVSGGARGEKDARERWFPIGTACYALAVALAVLSPQPVAPLTTVVIRTLLYATTFMMSQYFLLVLGRKSLPLLGWVLFGAGVGLATVGLGTSGSPRAGGALHHFFLASIQLHLLTLLFGVWRTFRSRGAMSIAVAIAIVILANGMQLISIATAGRSISPSASSIESVSIYLANLSCVILFSVGYLALRAELANAVALEMATARASEENRRRSAEIAAEASRALVVERNKMILHQSRFEARNNLGLFNAAVIHEISQPLQKIMLDIESLARSPTFASGVVPSEIDELRTDISSVAGIVHALRSVLTDTKPVTSPVGVVEVINPIRSIIEGEAAHRSIVLVIDQKGITQTDQIEVDSALFNRVILNLIANSFQSLANRQGFRADESPAVTLEFRGVSDDTGDKVEIRCRDNGEGVTGEFDLSLERVPVSSRDSGMGVGLILSKQLISMWRGSIDLAPLTPGLEVKLTLPLIRPARG